ncbi:hypothetical protein D8B26_006691 [Coccidioides posadasii str. Silveira]|uniref:uncharacterized protein n=1 Tax=Coccidioides posadasii (strain RMSCC 757 / Silveira) TaxID=443226 RepID=UPI001BEEE182|nr:hypothetical protein D8B26_006691 [Coccidioides posadasii str. Silveira]
MYWPLAWAIFTTSSLVTHARSITTHAAPPDGGKNPQISKSGLETVETSREGLDKLLSTDSSDGFRGDPIKPYGGKVPIHRNSLLRSEQFRRLVGDLQTCGTDLLSYGSEDFLARSTEVKGSSIRSCREAIFTFLKWTKGDNPYLNLSSVSRAQLIKSALDGDCGCAYLPSSQLTFSSLRHGHAKRNNIDGMDDPPAHGHTQFKGSSKIPRANPLEIPDVPTPSHLQACEEKMCRIGDLDKICTQPKYRMTMAEIGVCKMCYPKNEEQLRLYCIVREKRERRAFFVASAMVAIFAIGVAGVIVFNDCVQKRAREASSNMGEGRIYPLRCCGLWDFLKRPWASRVCGYFKRGRETTGVEGSTFNRTTVTEEAVLAKTFEDGNSTNADHSNGYELETIDPRALNIFQRVGTYGNWAIESTIPAVPQAERPNIQRRFATTNVSSAWMSSRESFDIDDVPSPSACPTEPISSLQTGNVRSER